MRLSRAALALLFVYFALDTSWSQPRPRNPERPIVFIPGILGSKLCQGRTELWGGTGRRSLEEFHKLDLSLNPQVPITKCGLISQVQVLGPLYSVKAYVALQRAFSDWGLVDSGKLFIFDYDWRKSNKETAKDLEQFVNDKIGRTGKFDIVSHSMGGIVARIYMHNARQNQRVHKAIYLGTPFLGSMNTLGTLSEGWGMIPNWLSGGVETIQTVALSFPSMLELLPRYKQCCSLKTSAGQYTDIDVFKAETWKQYQWLPPHYTQEPAYSTFKANLASAGELSTLLATAPVGVTEVRIAGRAKDTRYVFAMREGFTKPSASNWKFTMQGGDGTVPVWSAARNLETLAGSLPSFSEHSTIFDDPAVLEQLERELFPLPAEVDRPIAGLGSPTFTVSVGGERRDWTVERIRIVPNDTYVSAGTDIEGDIVLKLSAGSRDVRPNIFKPNVFVRQDATKTPMTITETTTASDAANLTLTYRVSGVAASSREGIAELLLELPGSRELKEFMVVLE